MSSNPDQIPRSLQLSSDPFPRFGSPDKHLPAERHLQTAARLYEQMKDMVVKLDQTTTLVDAARISDAAEALEAIAKLAHDPELELRLAEIRVRAKRRMGELSLRLERANGVNLPNVDAKPVGKKATLEAAGISRDVAHRCEQLAKVDDGEFQTYLEDKRLRGEPASVADVFKTVIKKQKANERAARAVASPDALHSGDLAELAQRGLKFGTIYADPPWQDDSTGCRGAAEHHYPTMSVEDIAALPVGSLAADDAHLHLWTTSNFLFEAKRVMDAWGFEYKGLFVWVKPQLGTGSYYRVSSEFLLLGVRGRGVFEDKGIRNWGQFDRRAHSEKPLEIRTMVERVSPGPRLELFGRAPAERWVVWGNEAPRGDFAANVDTFFGKKKDEDGGPPTDFGGLLAA